MSHLLMQCHGTLRFLAREYGGLSKWCGIEKNKIHKGLAQHWPVHLNHTSSFVQPYVHVFDNVALWTTCSFLLTEIFSKSPGFIKCWPRCLNPNTTKASQSQRTHAAFSDAYMHVTHRTVYQAQFMQMSFYLGVLLAVSSLFAPGLYSSWVIL